MLSSLITIVSVFISMLILNVPLTLVTVVMLAIMVTATKKIASLSGKFFMDQQVNIGKVNGYIEEMMEGQKEMCIRDSVKGMEIVKEVAMEQEANRIALQYQIHNRSKREGIFSVTPFFQFVAKNQDLDPLQEIHFCPQENKVESEGIQLFFRTNGDVLKIPEERETLFYSYDVCDGCLLYTSRCV